MEGCFMFQWEGGGVAFQIGGAPWGGHRLWLGRGGSRNIVRWGGVPSEKHRFLKIFKVCLAIAAARFLKCLTIWGITIKRDSP